MLTNLALPIRSMQSAVLAMGKESDLVLIIDFSKVCTKSESNVMFWDQDAWGTPVTLTFFY